MLAPFSEMAVNIFEFFPLVTALFVLFGVKLTSCPAPTAMRLSAPPARTLIGSQLPAEVDAAVIVKLPIVSSFVLFAVR